MSFERYKAALHGVQSAIAYEIEAGISKDTSLKQLRVGINSALVDCGALAGLLIEKGIIDEAEYFESLAAYAEAELKRYEDKYKGITFR